MMRRSISAKQMVRSKRYEGKEGRGVICCWEILIWGALDTMLSQENKIAFETWREHDDALVNFCQADGKI